MENHLYLLEFFVEAIEFSSNLPEYPYFNDVVIEGHLGEITLAVSNVRELTKDIERVKQINLNCGRSILFASNPQELLQRINENPFNISLLIKNKKKAEAPVGWTKDFYTLIKNPPEGDKSAGPVVMRDQFLLTDVNSGSILGEIKASVRLSCFGSNIQTSFQMLSTQRDSNKKYLVQGARGNTTFECQKFVSGPGGGNSGEVLPLTPLFESHSPTSSVRNIHDDGISFMALFKSTIDPNLSALPEEFNIAITSVFDNKHLSNMTFDIVSLMERPEEKKMIDLRIKGNEHGLIFEFDKGIFDSSPHGSSSLVKEKSIEIEEPLSINKINRMLCKNKDCPAAKKFKQYGIGPLANIKGLGGIYGEPSLPVTYGMSQMFGVFNEYGPYGLFSKPKRPSDPFEPPSRGDNNWASACWKPKRRKNENQDSCSHQKLAANCPLRLNGGGDKFGQECPPLRLTGGGVLDYDDENSPFRECKEIMDQFDQVLYKYKKALGPCGKTTCPFAPNVVKEACKNMCPAENMNAYSSDTMTRPSTPSESVPRRKKFKLKGACGSNKCAYAKYKNGLTDEDAEMELQYLPSATSGKCGHPKCPFPVEPDLPPIHWECPDPLPKGPCKNPNCPYLPKEIKCLNEVLNKGPCGNFNCPFAPPPPCDSPYCPFQSKECPYKKNEENESICANSDCPFAEKNKTCVPPPSCGDNPCRLPPCPYGVNPYYQNLLALFSLLSGNKDAAQLCFPNPCPTPPTDPCQSVPKKPSPCYVPDTSCENPSCPYAPQPEDNASSLGCGSPDCPHGKTDCSPKASPCYLPEDDTCANPACPYASEPQPCPPPSCPIPPFALPFPCPYGIDPLQALLSCMPLSLCPDGVCPYSDKNQIQICFMPPPPPPPCQPAGTQEQEPSIASGKIDHIVETRTEVDNAPCTTETCEKSGGDLVCDECPCCDDAGNGEPQVGQTEYKSETRISLDNAPCTKQTCKAEGGDLSCPCCGGDGEPDLGVTDYKSETRISIDNAPCTKKTCESTGGKLVCDSCPCSQKAGKVKTKSGKKKKSKGKYVYSVGDKYPGVQIGHKECVLPGCNVPAKMGWLWNIRGNYGLKPRRGWRPGAVGRTIAERIRKHRESQGLPMLELKSLRRGKKGYGGDYESEASINVQPKPTLQIKKQDGCYLITMNPLKDPHSLVENESPYMDCTPLQFKILKNKNAKSKAEGDNEYQSCFCGDEENEESSSDSELEIEFTPPAGIIHPERFKKKKNVVHCDTQYMTEDFEKKSEAGTSKKGKKGKKGKGKKGGKKGGKKKKKK